MKIIFCVICKGRELHSEHTTLELASVMLASLDDDELSIDTDEVSDSEFNALKKHEAE